MCSGSLMSLPGVRGVDVTGDATRSIITTLRSGSRATGSDGTTTTDRTEGDGFLLLCQVLSVEARLTPVRVSSFGDCGPGVEANAMVFLAGQPSDLPCSVVPGLSPVLESSPPTRPGPKRRTPPVVSWCIAGSGLPYASPYRVRGARAIPCTSLPPGLSSRGSVLRLGVGFPGSNACEVPSHFALIKPVLGVGPSALGSCRFQLRRGGIPIRRGSLDMGKVDHARSILTW